VTAALFLRVDDPAAFLDEHYRPVGNRLQLMVPTPSIEAVDHAARALVSARGLDPLRRVATMQPRPGENRLRTSDVIGFFERYGHEYSVALLSPSGLDVDRITTTAAAVGCTLGWYTNDDADAAPLLSAQRDGWHRPQGI
jgi:kynureninase